MKHLIFLFGIFLISFGNIFGQDAPGVANGSIAKNGRDDYDNGIRIRSMELERVKTEAYRAAIAEKALENRKINYSQIKTDFELVQTLENSIVKTYVTGKKINYERIAELASKLNDCAKRLDTNLMLFSDKQQKKDDKQNTEITEIKDVIVMLDKSVGDFVASPMFKNLNVFESKDSEKAEMELQKIIRLSFILEQKSKLQ